MKKNLFFIFFSVLLLSCLLLVPAPIVHARAYVDDNNQAVKLLEDGQYRDGIDLLKKSLAAVPGNRSIQQNILNSYLTAGRFFVKQRQYEELVDLMLEAQEFDDSQRDFWSMRGYALLRLHQYDEAESELQEARVMGAPDSQILFLLGDLYYNTDRMFEAFDVLESALLQSPEDDAIARMFDKVKQELSVEQEMDKEYGGHFVVTFDGEHNENLGQEILEVLEGAYVSLGSQLDHYPQERVTVILYSRQQFSDLTDSPEWAGGLYDGKIRLPVGGIIYVDDDVRGLLYHEYMHVLLRDIAGKNLPYWLNEGLAEMAESEYGLPDLTVLSTAREQQNLFRLRDLDGPFRRFKGLQVPLAYQQSYAVVRFFIDEYGWHNVRDLVFHLGDGLTVSQSFDETLGVYGLTYDSFEGRWLDEANI